jgi:hypothetical protein
MSFRRLTLVLATCLIATFSIGAFAQAAKVPTIYTYSKCNSKKTFCNASVYTNGSNTSTYAVSVVAKCSDGTIFSASSPSQEKIKNGKFSFKTTVSTYEKADPSKPVSGTAKISGSVSKKSSAKVKYSVDHVSSNCSRVKSGHFKLKYSGISHGG